MKKLILLFSVLFTTMSFAQVPSYVPANGLVGWWPFNGNANDESGYGNNGTVNGASLTSDRNGVVNQAYSFDGYNDFISINDNQTLNVSNVTVSAWYNAVDYGSAQQGFQGHIVSKRESSGWGTSFQLALENSTPNHTIWATYTIAGNGWAYYSSNSVLTSQNWIHVTYTHDNTSAKIFINGILVNTTLISGGLQTNNLPLWFGARPNAGENSAFFNGKLDDIGIWNRALTDCEIQNLYNSSNPTNTTTASACDSYTWNGTTYTSSGTYTGTTANCVTQSLNLTITPSSTNTTPISACNSYTWNGTTYTTSGVYTGTTSNCVTQALNLTINTNTSSSISQTALDSYTWPVNSQTYTTTGAYTAVIPNAAGCDSTITLNLTMSFTGINDLSTSKLSVFPNPTNGDFTITGLELLGSVSSLSLTDMNGKVVKVLDTKATKFSMASIKPGVYFLNIISGNKEEVLKIVKE